MFPLHPLSETFAATAYNHDKETANLWHVASCFVLSILNGNLEPGATKELLEAIQDRATDPLCVVLMFNDEAYYRMAVGVVKEYLEQKCDKAFGRTGDRP